MAKISKRVSLNESELKFSFVRSPGPGGQNVNKVASAVQLRFDIKHSLSLTEPIRQRLIKIVSNKITRQGELIIKASRFRTQERNKQDALARLQELLNHAATPPKTRKKTKPSLAAKDRRLTTKKLHGKNKALRRSKPNDEM
jgi:ribosome-associated protein